MSDADKEKFPDGCPTMRLIAMPKDSNAAGDIFGGWLVSQIDLAGAIVGAERANGLIATVAMKDIHLMKPAFIGDILSFFAEVSETGRTSLTITVDVWASRLESEAVKVAEGIVVYVALGEDRKPRILPSA